MRLPLQRTGIGHDRASWPMLLLLALGVLVPTACVLWFMNAAMRNERLIGRQRLLEAYRGNLAAARDRLAGNFHALSLQLGEAAAHPNPSQTFARLVRGGAADSVVLLDAGGRLAYPDSPRPPSRQPEENADAWRQAAELEFNRADLPAAARAYAAIAVQTRADGERARALEAQARCLLGAGDKRAAAALIARAFAPPALDRATDSHGRLIAADTELMALRVLPALSRRLQARLDDYDNSIMASPQRLFLMKELRQLGIHHPMLEAEELAARWAAEVLPGPMPRLPSLRASPLKGHWQISSPDGRAIALFKEESVNSRLSGLLQSLPPPNGVHFAIVPPGGAVTDQVIHSLEAGEKLPGWKLSMSWRGDDPLDRAASSEITTYLWIALLVIAVIGILTFLTGWLIRRQMRLARLKNDLVATVSHELKTPLASMRLLVDTLIEAEEWDPVRVREYLDLISKENLRLSRLIENFLSFSRMERNRHAFQFRPVRAEEVVAEAAGSIGERLESCKADFKKEIEPEMPPFSADPDALVTVLVNLVDNACKYSGGDPRIRLRAFSDNGSVCFSVSDNGIGLSDKEQKRIFDRFYQADNSLTRQAGGCGLGLSIVDYIVRAHGGSISVDSAPGRGSTFTIRFSA